MTTPSPVEPGMTRTYTLDEWRRICEALHTVRDRVLADDVGDALGRERMRLAEHAAEAAEIAERIEATGILPQPTTAMHPLRGHGMHCRYAIFTGTAFADQWPADPERCDACRARAATPPTERPYLSGP